MISLHILKKIWPYAILAILCLIFWPELSDISGQLLGAIAGAIGFLFWSKRTKLDTKPDKAEAAESEIQSDIRLKEAISELEQLDIIRDKIKAEKIAPMPDEPAPGKVRKVFKAR